MKINKKIFMKVCYEIWILVTKKVIWISQQNIMIYSHKVYGEYTHHKLKKKKKKLFQGRNTDDTYTCQCTLDSNWLLKEWNTTSKHYSSNWIMPFKQHIWTWLSFLSYFPFNIMLDKEDWHANIFRLFVSLKFLSKPPISTL